ncbi:MAG: hypothetical protein K6U04_10585 [Armatimonadetes bacterium]|nr:hypothetical protein [Armatimonadota bacterium]
MRGARGQPPRALAFLFPGSSGHSLAEEPAIKITRLGIRQEDALVTIDLKNYRDREDKGAGEEKEAFRAVQEYYDLFAKAVARNDVSILEARYGYLKPTGKRDGINHFREKFSRPIYRNATRALRYEVSYDEPIVTVKENTAIVDVHGIEKYIWGEGRGEFSGGEYSAVFHLERTAGKWRIAMIDELLEEECWEFR